MRLQGSVSTGKILDTKAEGYLKDVRKGVQALLEEYGQKITREMQARAPVDQGDIRQGIHYVLEVENKGKRVTLRLVSSVPGNVPYNAYQEFGTGDLVQVDPEYSDYARTYYVNGQGHTPPSPFFFPAYEQHRRDLIHDFRNLTKQTA